jgi:hypothetical protein
MSFYLKRKIHLQKNNRIQNKRNAKVKWWAFWFCRSQWQSYGLMSPWSRNFLTKKQKNFFAVTNQRRHPSRFSHNGSITPKWSCGIFMKKLIETKQIFYVFGSNIENILCTYKVEFLALVLTVRLTFFDRNQTTIGNHLFTSLFILIKYILNYGMIIHTAFVYIQQNLHSDLSSYKWFDFRIVKCSTVVSISLNA